MTNMNLAGERAQLLFVTNRAALTDRYSANAVDELFQAFEGQARLLDVNSSSAPEISGHIRGSIGDAPGVVLLGGYDVIPAQRTFCVPADSTARLQDDPEEGFVVWSDDIYGDIDADGLPDRPVSRVPDAGSLEFLAQCLNAPPFRASPPYGLVNKLRPFADEVFQSIQGSGSGSLQHSRPVNLRSMAPGHQPNWQGCRVGYLMLHGFSDNGALFQGQVDPNIQIDAFSPQDVPALDGGFVFAGCCWGALIADAAAVTPPGARPRTRMPNQSIALTALSCGAVAFIGSTGLVLSPATWDAGAAPTGDDYYCKPLHVAFWQRCAEGLPPAHALLEAKLDYFLGIPHPGASNLASDVQAAQEIKQFREMTCLGLGW